MLSLLLPTHGMMLLVSLVNASISVWVTAHPSLADWYTSTTQ